MQVLKYLVIAGEVVSRTDGDVHFVSAQQLIRLYGVDPRECQIAPDNRRGWKPDPELIQLTPRYNGDYSLPKDTVYRPKVAGALGSGPRETYSSTGD